MLEIDIADAEHVLDADDLDEDEQEEYDALQRRSSTAGPPRARKHYQQQLGANFMLPYHSLLEEEAATWFAEIKEGLARSVLTGDYRPGLVLWFGRMEQYLRLYGRRFDKADHVQLVRFFFELVIDHNMEASIVARSAQILTDLLRKTELLTPDDVQIPWRKLYETYEHFQYNRDEWHGLMSVPDSLERRLTELIHFCRVYFAPEAAQEMLDTWRPLLCPHSSSMKKAIKYFSMFLPTVGREGEQPWKVWFDEMMGIWMTFSGVPTWESDLVSLLARVALETSGHIDWRPYISVIFNKFLRNLKLPVGKKRLKLVFGGKAFDATSAAMWPVGMLHHEECLVALETLFKAVESYFYPSNHGEWSGNLSSVIMRLALGVVARVNAERYREKSWTPEVPVDARLTDATIRRFVKGMKPLVLLNMYSKSIGPRLESMFALKNLAELCPEEIVPDILERLYPALDALTEPQRLTVSLSGMSMCMRSLLMMPDGRKHVLPLLLGVLPGIDSNDFRKSGCTFQFLTALLSMVPLEDSSRYGDRDELTPEERDLCLETSGFEDFALQCMERCLTYILNSTNDLHGRHDSVSRDINERMTQEERFTRLGMSSLIATIIFQSSDNICQAILQKLYSFVSNRTLSYSHYTGVAVSSFCAMAMKFRLRIAETEILEPLIKMLKVRVDLRRNDIPENDQIDDELAWTVKLVSDSLVFCGKSILTHRNTLLECLEVLKETKCTQLFKLVAGMVRAVLRGVLSTFPVNIGSVDAREMAEESGEYVPVRQWGKLVQPRKVQMDWHVADEEELDFAEEMLGVLLLPALEALQRHASGEGMMERKELERTLLMVEMCVAGAGIRFPFDTAPEKRLLPCPTSVEIYSKQPDPIISLSQREIRLRGQPARDYIFQHVQPVLRKISAADEDDVKSIKIILRIFKALMFFRGLENEELQMRIKAHIISRKTMTRVLGSKKEQMRLVVFERVLLQHERRHYDHRGSPLTVLRSAIMKEMIDLATGQYRDVRVLGQNYFQDALANLQFTYRAFVDDIISKLETSKDNKEMAAQMKGALYLIFGGKGGSLVTKHDWHTLSKCFPCLIKVTSESKTVSLIFDKLADKMDRHFSTTTIHIVQAEKAMEVARQMLVKNAGAAVDGDPPSVHDMEEMWENRAVESRENEKLFFVLVNELLDFVRERLTKPKNFHFSLFVLSHLIRRDVALEPNMIDTFMDNWANPSSEKARKLSQHPMLSFMRWLKRPIVRTEVHLKNTLTSAPNGLPPAGIRPDNLWLCFDEAKLPRNTEEYDNTIFVEKIQHGYYGWPETLKLAAPLKDQICLGKVPESLNQLEKIIYEKMTDEAYVDILIRLLSVEDSKLHGKFDTYTYWIFRTLFRHFEDAFLPLLLPHLQRLIASKEEHQQRCAAEILTGIIRGSKRWPYKKITHLWEQLTPLLKLALNNLTTESLADWGELAHSGLNEGDARRTYPLLKVLFDLPKNDTSFQASSRLYVLQSAFFVQYDWRRKELHQRIEEIMKERMEERYRDRVAWTLANMYRCEIQLPNLSKEMEQGPKFVNLLKEYFPRCKELLKSGNSPTELEDIMRLFKTMVKLICQHVLNTMGFSPPELQWFLPLLMRFESDTRDDELRRDCVAALACLSQIALSPAEIGEMLGQVERILADVGNALWWRDRVLALEHLQTAVFSNFFAIQRLTPSPVARVKQMVLGSLEDESLEVREMACVTLAGLAQCGFLQLDKPLLDRFYRQSETPVIKQPTDARTPKSLLTRHAGVLGLCAYIVSQPYGIGQHEPDVLVLLSGHVNDPQPVNQTVKNTIKEFRRTHLDNWAEHKTKFTEEQLALLTDLLVSPTYYA
ncbi:proteasome activator complex subunit 4A-like isoform X2 [Paramacrobiotus metropolitanus]|nr:proteasome activator complex subunit 4A-like isoform X2 [Paramacrobiotus metropolitanus]XP_055349231.1 proteasome activator complex subunit 4A-like isoform X2 [Paramacrobiotus metropolitanus]